MKDSEIVNHCLSNPSSTLLTSVFGARFTNEYDHWIASASNGVYAFFALLAGQTLGEELCDMLAVTRGHPWIPISTTRKLLLALLYGVEQPCLSWFARRYFPLRPSDEVVAVVDKVVLCLLMLFERFGTLRHRLLRVRFLSLRAPETLRQGPGARHTYLFAGLITAVTLIIRLVRYYRSVRGQSSRKALPQVNLDASDSEEEASDGDACPICFSKKKCPTCTPCGHVFCWNCIAESGQKDSRCPLCRQNFSLPSLVPLYFYQGSS